MTAAELQALAAQKRAETLEYQGLTEQHRLTGLTFGQPACNTHLIAKLRRMDPDLYKTITTKDTP
ncbi:hypothetical protein FBY30_2769 [Arthrobacter sp. SLBN-83]|uniref:hypothetical protein n=1 Tax=Arthrobacter sp. SLBN-83 TaxID=2768449 RepID=UPI0011507665|nr:hypothetical protein [Arthrobacter sp. SLBN-83]TQJ60501.1 hypothetical protein FBY30_2769 [Arthrobacter sp. SLBN-83]